jgi:hypothetical protein
MTVEQLRRRKDGLESPAKILGGQISKEKVLPEIRVLRSSRAGNAVLQRFGREYYSFLGRLSAARRRDRNSLS